MEDYKILKSMLERLLTLNLSLNHLVSKLIRFSYEFEASPIKIFINKGIKSMLQDKDFQELNCIRVLWLTIDKISRD